MMGGDPDLVPVATSAYASGRPRTTGYRYETRQFMTEADWLPPGRGSCKTVDGQASRPAVSTQP